MEGKEKSIVSWSLGRVGSDQRGEEKVHFRKWHKNIVARRGCRLNRPFYQYEEFFARSFDSVAG